jgi:hypothetical protein
VTTGAQLARTGEAGDDGSVPLWATIVVALGSGLGGAILSTLLRISHERDAEMRTRKIDAADAYLTPDASGLSDEADQLRRGLKDAVSKVHHTFPRVLLLFGDDSWAGKWAGDVLLALRAAVREAVAWPQPAPDDALRQFERASMGQFPLHSGSAVHSRDLHLRE